MKIIITGGPCTGKTSLIEALSFKDYTVHPEFARVVIAEQLALKTDLVPWLNNVGFSSLVLEKMLALNASITDHKLHFFDRGIPDLAAYLHVTHNSLPDGFAAALTQANYHSTVFLLPPWEEIYANDNERKESFDKALEIYHALKSTYKDLGFDVVEVPKLPIEERLDYILQMV
jgi:predicted ATPase